MDLGAIGSVVGDIVGAGLSYMGAESANANNRHMAREQMAFQERMANTQYQRAVKDLEAAGLNPMMAYGNIQTSSPQGALGHAAQNPFAVAGPQIGSAVSKGAETAMKMAQIQNLEEQNEQIRATTAREVATTAAQSTQADLNRAQTLKVDQDILTNAALQVLYTTQAKNTSALTGKISAETQGIQFENVGRGAESRMYSRPGGDVIPYGKAILPAVSSAVGGATIGSILGGKIKFGRRPHK